MSDLTVTYRTSVTPDQIDQLGHMNVRFYGVNAHQGTLGLLESLGHGDLHFEMHDTYTRHHHEQLLDAPLEVRSCILSVSPTVLELYHELRNSESEDLAATFVHRLTAPKSLGPNAPLPAPLVAKAADLVMPMPAHGKPRTVSLDGPPVTTIPSLETMREHGLAIRQVRTITEDDCDDSGYFAIANIAELTWGGETIVPRDTDDDWLIDLANGQRMGWAAMESRHVVLRLPKAGDRVQSFSVTLTLADKVSHRMHVVYDVDNRDALTLFEGVSLAFDVNARRAMSIPDSIRSEEETKTKPELFGRPAAP